jgi:UDP-2,3-diacylglucosamine hydrolase
MNSKLAIIAGKGDLPKMIIKKCQEQGREFLVILINGEASNVDFLQYEHHIIGFGEISKILGILKTNQIKELVFAGGVTKPSMAGMKVDGKGAILVSKILGNKFFGDDNLLSTIINFFEKEGFRVVGAEQIIDDLLAGKGVLGNIKPNSEMQKDIEIGQHALKVMSDLDIGQAIVVQQKQIVGVEAIEGTDALIKRCADLQFRQGSKAVLVKIKKSNQNTKIDLPALGVETINNLAKSGFAGAAVQSGSCLIINQKEVVRLADELGLFIIGI